VVTLVAWGGVGKTALVNHWLIRLAQDNYRGATRVYGYSFYSQGAAEGKQASADLFIATALRDFGDPEPDAGSPWDKGERLARLLQQAVDGLRQAGQQQELPRGLMARAELYRMQGDFAQARRDIDEAMTMATRGEMGLHQTDGHLEYARLYLAMDHTARARGSLATARVMVARMGYHRRDAEVQELEERLVRS
jgi:hypothetical protein